MADGTGKDLKWILLFIAACIVAAVLWRKLQPPSDWLPRTRDDHLSEADTTSAPPPPAPPLEEAPPPAPIISDGKALVPPRSSRIKPVTQPEYPATSKRLGEQGTVIMLLTIEADGHVSAAEVSKTSGYDRLDQASLKGALKWHLLPGTVDDVPTKMQYKFAVTFKITD
jgi:protein TonB